MNKEQIDAILTNIYNDIFKNVNTEILSKYEKRKMIYDYIVENRQYDFVYFEGILKGKRDGTGQTEFYQALTTNRGICNSLSQLYKVLLEKIDIFSE